MAKRKKCRNCKKSGVGSVRAGRPRSYGRKKKGDYFAGSPLSTGTMIGMAGGAAVIGYVDTTLDSVQVVKDNEIIKAVLKVVGGVALSKQGNEYLQGAGFTFAVSGIAEGVKAGLHKLGVKGVGSYNYPLLPMGATFTRQTQINGAEDEIDML